MWYQKARSRIRSPLAWVLAPALLIAAAASCDQQAPAGPNDAGVQPLFKGKPGGGDPISVDNFNPKEGEQGQRFAMAVSGSGFGKGAKVVFVLNGEDVSTISTTTTFVDETGENLTADVDVGLDAVVSEDYEVAVALRGSRGVGTESFTVKVPPGQTPSFTATITGDVSSVEPIGLPRHPGLQTDPGSPATLDLSFFTTALTNGSACFAAGNPFTGVLQVTVKNETLGARIRFAFTAKDKDGMTKIYELALVGVIDVLANWPAVAGPSTITGESFNMHIGTGPRRIACTGTGPLSFIMVLTRNE